MKNEMTIEEMEKLLYEVSEEEYFYFKKEMIVEKPYGMANKELAKQYFERYKKEVPGATMYEYDYRQYICSSDAARKELQEMIEQLLEKKMQEVEMCKILLKEIKGE